MLLKQVFRKSNVCQNNGLSSHFIAILKNKCMRYGQKNHKSLCDYQQLNDFAQKRTQKAQMAEW